jgi:hypothetical protein
LAGSVAIPVLLAVACEERSAPPGAWPVWSVCPGQQTARIEAETARNKGGTSGADSKEAKLRELVDRAVLGEEPPPGRREAARSEPSWELKLASTLDAGRPTGGAAGENGSTVAELEAQLEEARRSIGPGSLRREAAVAANLAAALARDADVRGLRGEDRIAALRHAISVLEGQCQVPEVFLNEAAMRLELAELLLGEDRERELAAARGRLSDLEQSDADGCSDTPGQFFGIDPSAPNLYILDGSESIRAEPQLKRLFDEFTRTVSSLPENDRFAAFVFARSYVPVSIPGTREDRGGWSMRGTATPKAIEQAIRGVLEGMGSQKLNATRPKAALERAIEMGATTVYLVTDGAIGDGEAGDLAKVRKTLASAKVKVNTVLLFREDPGRDRERNLAALKRASEPLKRMADETGGRFVTRIVSPRGSDFNLSGRTILAAMRDRGRWTPANERQYRTLLGDLAVFAGDLGAAAEQYRLAIAAVPSGVDPVTGKPAEPCGDWPSAGGVGLPPEPGLLFRWACAERAANGSVDAFRNSAEAIALASKAGRLDTSRMGPKALKDLACRLLLLEALSAAPEARPAAIESAIVRAGELGILGSGWNGRLLKGAAGGFDAWRTGLACRVFPDDTGRAAIEWDIVRAAFLAEEASSPDLSGFPILERAVLAGIVASPATIPPELGTEEPGTESP